MEGMGIGGGRRIRRNELENVWILWKKSQIFIRKHLSHIFALLLGFGILIRERHELIEIWRNAQLSQTRIFIIIALLLTVATAIWRIRAYTLNVSRREVRVAEIIGLVFLALGIASLIAAYGEIQMAINNIHFSWPLILTIITVLIVIWGIQSELKQQASPVLYSIPFKRTSMFRVSDVVDSVSLIHKLRNEQDPLSQYLHSKLMPATVELIMQYTSSGKPKKAILTAIIDDFNRLLQGPLLYERESFAQVSLRAETQRLIQNNLQGKELITLNRMLLEDAYSHEITRNFFKEVRLVKAFSVLVVGIGVISVILGKDEIMRMLVESKIDFGRALILTLTVLTIVAALWELRGNKLTTSPQEIRFVGAMRLLLNELEKFTFGKDQVQDIGKRLDQFVADFLEITCNTLCGKKRVDGGLMQLRKPTDTALSLIQSSRSAYYPDDLKVPCPNLAGIKESGPAGVSYDLLSIVYMPFKRWKLGWPFKLIRNNGRERYEPSSPNYGWIPALPEREKFRSVLCIPVGIYTEKNQKEPLGVLNYSTSSFDPFVDRDFIMGECFGSILAQAFAAARREASEQKNKSSAQN